MDINDNKEVIKQQKFERLATSRTNMILQKIRILGNLSDTNRYSYKEEQIEQMFTAIDQEVKRIRDKFNESIKDREFRFEE